MVTLQEIVASTEQSSFTVLVLLGSGIYFQKLAVSAGTKRSATSKRFQTNHRFVSEEARGYVQSSILSIKQIKHPMLARVGRFLSPVLFPVKHCMFVTLTQSALDVIFV